MTRRPAATFEAGAATRWLVVATAAGAVTGGRAAVAGRDAVVAEGRLALILVMAVAKAKHLLVVVRLGAAPGAATIFPKHPHVEGRVAVLLEMEGAPPTQAARTGKRLPAVGQGYVARDRDLNRDRGSSAAAAIRLQPEPAWTCGR